MKSAIAAFTLALLLMMQRTRAANSITVDLWPGGKPPGQTSEPGPDTVNKSRNGSVRLTNITRPQIEIHLPAREKYTGTALIIAPGGGFRDLGWDFEGQTMVKWCDKLGVAGIILKYRVPRGRNGALDAFLDGAATAFPARLARRKCNPSCSHHRWRLP